MPSSSSKPQHPTIAEDHQPRDCSEITMPKDDRIELDHSLQVQSASSASSQSTSARERLKAGQRRLRQLAQRQWKATDPKIKPEEASRYLHALQEEGFLPMSTTQGSGPEMNFDSDRSASRPTANSNFKSSSQRDVEQIGQPWLEPPIEISDKIGSFGSELSVSDLRQLTSLVEAAVSLPPRSKNTISPPDQALVNSNDDKQAGALESAKRELAPSFEPKDQQENEHTDIGLVPTSPKRDGKDTRDQIPAVLIPGNTGFSNDKSKHKRSKQTSDALVTQGNPIPAREKPISSKPAAPRDGPAPTAPMLKLFPDTCPPRISSKSALTLRIPNTRVLGKEAGISPVTLGAQQKRAPTTTTAKAEKSYLTPRTSSEQQQESEKSSIDSANSKSSKPCSEPARSPIHPHSTLSNNNRRPASLPIGTTDSFHLSAPKKPLPSLPEPIAALNTTRHQSTPASDNSLEASAITQASSTNKTENCHSATNQAALPRLRFDEKDSLAYQQDDSRDETTTLLYRQRSFVKTRQNREDKARALKLRDMTGDRVYIKGPESPRAQTKNQTIESSVSSRSREHGRHLSDSNEISSQSWGGHGKDVNASNPPSPPRLPLPPQLPLQLSTGMTLDRQHCSSPSDFIQVVGERRETSSLPASKRNSLLDRSNSTQSTGVLYEMASRASKTSTRAGSPLPSSDEECIGNSAPASESRRVASKHSRTRRSRRILEDSSSSRSRHSRVSTIPSYIEPLTPRRQSRRSFENFSPQSHNSHGSYSSRGLPGRSDNAMQALSSLERRIAQLEHQNRMLQAALFAALDAGGKCNLEDVLSGSATSGSAAASSASTERSSLSSTDRSIRGHRRTRSAKYLRPKKTVRRPGSWIDSPGSSNQSDYQSDDSISVRELEDMIEDIEVNWMTDEPTTKRI